jgi:hypothetical protein
MGLPLPLTLLLDPTFLLVCVPHNGYSVGIDLGGVKAGLNDIGEDVTAVGDVLDVFAVAKDGFELDVVTNMLRMRLHTKWEVLAPRLAADISCT